MKSIKQIAAFALTAVVVPFAATAGMSRAEWQAKVGDCAKNPAMVKATIAQIPAAEQTEFLAKVNSAIAKKPGSIEAMAVDFYSASKAALVGAKDKKAVLAEIFATVPVEHLTVLNERLSAELFSRNANPDKPVSDAAFENLAKGALAVVNKRCETAENAAARQMFAALMFVRASGGSPSGLADTLISQMSNVQARESASGWIAQAMGYGQEASYSKVLADSNAEEEPDHVIVHYMTGQMILESLLADLQAPGNQSAVGSAAGLGGGAFTTMSTSGNPIDGEIDVGLNRIPRGAIGSKTAVGGNSEGRYSDSGEENPYYSGKGRGKNPYYSGQRESSDYWK